MQKKKHLLKRVKEGLKEQKKATWLGTSSAKRPMKGR
jgi:hypothetical protein